MLLLIILALVMFGVSGVLGYRHSGARFWSVVDVFYEPLVVIGLTLLFLSNTNQRKLLQLTSSADKLTSELTAINAKRPQVSSLPYDGLVEASFSGLEAIAGLGQACSRLSSAKPDCSGPRGVEAHIREFLDVVRAESGSPKEEGLLVICSAGAKLLNDIRAKRALSNIVADDLADEYRALVGQGYGALEYDAVSTEVDAFRARTVAKTEHLRLAFDDNSDLTRSVFDTYKADAKLAGSILLGLYPCIVAPTKDLSALDKWKTYQKDKSSQLDQVRLERAKAKESSPDPVVAYIQLNLWPFILVVASSLKFGKGLANYRKTSAPSSPPEKPSLSDAATLPADPLPAQTPSPPEEPVREPTPSEVNKKEADGGN